MDGKTLQDIMQSPNWSMWGPATEAFGTGQEQAKATLADTLQKTKQSAELHPLLMDTERANALNLGATARSTNATAAEKEDALKVLQGVPMDQRVAAKMGEMYKTIAEGDKAKVGADMLKASKWAAQALQQGGQLNAPQMLQLSQEIPGLVNYFKQPNGAKVVANMVTAFNALGAERQQADSTAQIHAGATLGAANIAAKSAEARTKMEIDAGKFKKYSNDFQWMQLLQKNPAEAYAQKRLELAHEIPTLSGEEQQAARALYDQYTQMEATTREQMAKAAQAAAEVNAGKSPSISAIGSGQGLQAVPAPVPVRPSALGVPAPGPQPAPAASTKLMSPDAYQRWHDAAKAANPKLSDAEIMAEAQKRGYR